MTSERLAFLLNVIRDYEQDRTSGQGHFAIVDVSGTGDNPGIGLVEKREDPPGTDTRLIITFRALIGELVEHVREQETRYAALEQRHQQLQGQPNTAAPPPTERDPTVAEAMRTAQRAQEKIDRWEALIDNAEAVEVRRWDGKHTTIEVKFRGDPDADGNVSVLTRSIEVAATDEAMHAVANAWPKLVRRPVASGGGTP